MIRRILGLMRKELLQLLRDPFVLFIVLYMYTLEAVTCTRALTFEVRHMPFAVVDQDRSATSRRLIELFDLTEAFDLKHQADSPAAVAPWLERGEVGMVLVIPPDFAREHRAGVAPSVQMLLDGTYSNSAESALHYGHELITRFEREHPPLRVRMTAAAHAVAVPRVWYNPDQSTKTFMVLSMMAMAGMLVGSMVPAASIVREKERGTIEQLMMTPIGIGELFFAKTVPTVALNVLALFPAFVVVGFFNVPFRGSLGALLALAATFQLSAVAFGVLIASVTRTTQQALLLAFFGLFPILFLSGTLTPVESMPRLMQWLSLGSPMRYYLEILQGVFLKGAGLDVLWPQALALLAIGLVLFALAAFAFRRTSAVTA